MSEAIAPERKATRIAGSSSGRRRIAVCAGAGGLQSWQWNVLASVMSDHGNEIACIIDDGDGSFGDGTKGRMHAWRVADAVESRIAKVLGFRAVSAHKPHAELPRISGTVNRQALSLLDIDVVLDFSAPASAGRFTDLAKYGVWSLRSARSRYMDGRPLGFWEWYHGDPLCSVEIVAGDAMTAAPAVLARGTYSCSRLSWGVNASRLSRRVSWLLVDALRQNIVPNGLDESALSRQASNPPTAASSGGLKPAGALIKFASRIGREVIRYAAQEDRWRIKVFHATSDGRVRGPATILKPPPETYWADPFVLPRGEKCYVFFEEYLYADRRGIISYVELDMRDLKGGVLRPTARPLMNERHHLSYPFLFSYEGRLFMIPETSGNGTIELWECDDVPGKWHKVKNLMDGFRAVDSSLLEWNGKWWLFANLDQSGLRDNGNELHVFHTDDPIRGTWTPHAANPVVVDARRARMAGGFLRARDGRPVRCGQQQGRYYGEQVTYNLVAELTEERYVEVPWEEAAPVPIEPGRRTHHVNFRDGLLVADECDRSWRPARILMSHVNKVVRIGFPNIQLHRN